MLLQKQNQDLSGTAGGVSLISSTVILFLFFWLLLCYNNKCFCIDWYSSYRSCYCIFFFYSIATERDGCAIHWFSFESSLHIFYQSHSITFNNFWNNHHLKFWYTLSWKQLFFLFIFFYNTQVMFYFSKYRRSAKK